MLYNPEKDEIFLSNIGEVENLSEDELDELFAESIYRKAKFKSAERIRKSILKWFLKLIIFS